MFEPILKDAEKELLHGSHTRSISISTPSNGGIMKFAKKQLSCIGCKALISGKDQTLCSHCKGREAELYCKTVANVLELEILFGKLWRHSARSAKDHFIRTSYVQGGEAMPVLPVIAEEPH
ncbi:DNA polymerase delta catalytic subunit-like protein [Drosera capensis]